MSETIHWLDPLLDAKVFFPARCFDPTGRFVPELLDTFFERYTDPATGLSTVHWDDVEHTRRRNASIYDGSMAPSAVYDPPLESPEDRIGRMPIGYTIKCGWHPAFLADLRRDPQPEPELFEGVYEITD